MTRLLANIGLAALLATSAVGAQMDARAQSPLPETAIPARPIPRAVGLGPVERTDILQVERYLNGIDTLQARFAQTDNQGGFASGTLYLSRPGRLRFEYDPPSPILMVANGRYLVYQDRELDQTSHVRLSETPFGILLREKISLLDAGAMVTTVRHDAGRLHVTLVRAEEVEAGSLTLTFSDAPLHLREWTTIDPQGTIVRVALLAAQRGVALDPELFEPEQFQEPGLRD